MADEVTSSMEIMEVEVKDFARPESTSTVASYTKLILN